MSHIAEHDGKRLAVALLYRPQTCHRFPVQGITYQVIATNAFRRYHFSFTKQADGQVQQLIILLYLYIIIYGIIERPAMITGHRLRMETAVAYRRVFPPAVGTHGKGGHRGLLPVVRQITDDGETGAAMRTVDKRITQAMRLPHPVGKAFGANSDIGRYLRHLLRIGTAGCNHKIRIIRICNVGFFPLNTMDRSNCRMLISDPGNKQFPLLRSQDRTDRHSVISVTDLSFYLHLICYTIDKRTKANALH